MKKDIVFAVLLATPTAAFGYTDPGTGIFVYQALVATLVGAGWTARRLVARLFKRVTSHKTAVAGE